MTMTFHFHRLIHLLLTLNKKDSHSELKNRFLWVFFKLADRRIKESNGRIKYTRKEEKEGSVREEDYRRSIIIDIDNIFCVFLKLHIILFWFKAFLSFILSVFHLPSFHTFFSLSFILSFYYYSTFLNSSLPLPVLHHFIVELFLICYSFD